ncbi:hypothetical protein CSHISOI_07433 [Colletotrichum shisoi]|uniref:Uncharacterized protein n=1 Tax=Colletotrichum shisoi TaxID=2078593 RepID=A0A5Q4BM21_9PEZI|nr:hypothetical protein CSHISOI_07433 [Colletotrichum shisoi]
MTYSCPDAPYTGDFWHRPSLSSCIVSRWPHNSHRAYTRPLHRGALPTFARLVGISFVAANLLLSRSSLTHAKGLLISKAFARWVRRKSKRIMSTQENKLKRAYGGAY